MNDLLIFIPIAVALVIFILRIRKVTGGTRLVGFAKVVSKRTEQGKYINKNVAMWSENINYLVTFRLSDGEKIELHASQQQYRDLQEGQLGQLSWCNENLTDFTPQEV